MDCLDFETLFGSDQFSAKIVLAAWDQMAEATDGCADYHPFQSPSVSLSVALTKSYITIILTTLGFRSLYHGNCVLDTLCLMHLLKWFQPLSLLQPRRSPGLTCEGCKLRKGNNECLRIKLIT
jgi:hypothetical protein